MIEADLEWTRNHEYEQESHQSHGDDDEGNAYDLGYEHENIRHDQSKNPKTRQRRDPYGLEDKIVRAHKRSREYRVQVEVEDFKGTFNIDTFLDWLNSVGHFEWKELPDDRRLGSLAAS